MKNPPHRRLGPAGLGTDESRGVRGLGRVAIVFWDYCDFPRVFIVRWHGRLLLFNCPFDVREDYEDYFAVYELLPAIEGHLSERPWPALASEGIFLGRVPVKEAKFPFELKVSTEGTDPSSVPERGTGPLAVFPTGWMEDGIFEKLGLD